MCYCVSVGRILISMVGGRDDMPWSGGDIQKKQNSQWVTKRRGEEPYTESAAYQVSILTCLPTCLPAWGERGERQRNAVVFEMVWWCQKDFFYLFYLFSAWCSAVRCRAVRLAIHPSSEQPASNSDQTCTASTFPSYWVSSNEVPSPHLIGPLRHRHGDRHKGWYYR